MNKTKTILSDFYDAWRDQDMDRMASYLPHDFAHVIHVPSELQPLGGARLGKAASLEHGLDGEYLIALLARGQGDDDRGRPRRGRDPMHCRHREMRAVVKATKANFWTLESDWPVGLSNITSSGHFRT